MLPAGTALRMPAEGLKGRLEKVPQACKESSEGTMMDGRKYVSLPSTGAPHAFLV